MQGEDGDQGTSIFHNTELVGPILIGGLASAETPELFAPRNAGQETVTPWIVETEIQAATTKQSEVRNLSEL